MEGLCFGDFQVKKKIAEGGMGQIYLARQISLDRDVALKILPERFARDSSFKARFEREAREAARLNHPNIISVYAYGIKDGIPYFAMEFVEGEDLSRLLKKRGKFPVQEALRIAKEVAKALEAAHKKGIVHRDIKPSNIMLKEDGSVKVTDFGLAKAVGSRTMVTQAHTILGTPHYMSPEQGKGGKVDIRSDIYSLGVVLFELLSGRVPFHSDTPTSLIYMHVHEQPPSLREKNPEVPPAVDALVMKMLAKEPGERFQTPAELIKAIEAVESGATVVSADAPMTLEIGMDGALTVERVEPKKEQKSALIIVAVLLLIVAGAGLTVFFLSGGKESGESVVTVVPPVEPKEEPVEPKEEPKQPPETPPEEPSVERTSPDVEEKVKVNFPAAEILGRLPKGSRLFIRRAGEPKELNEPLFADKEFETGLYVITAERKGYKPIVHNFRLTKEGVEPPAASVPWEFELSDGVKGALRRAKVNIEEQKFRLAIDELESILEEVPDLKEAEELLAECREKYGNYQKTVNDFNRAKELIKEEKWEEALAVLNRLPTDFEDYVGKVLPLIERAKEQLEKRGQFNNYVSMAQEKLRKGELDGALDYIQNADLLIPNREEVSRLRETVHRLRSIRDDMKMEMEKKGYQKAYELVREFLRVAPDCEKMQKMKEFIEDELSRIAEHIRRFENHCRMSEEKMETSPEEALSEATRAKEVMLFLRDRYHRDVSEMKRKVDELVDEAEKKIAEKEIRATIKSMDSLFLSGRLNEFLTMVDPQNPALKKRLSKQLSDFLLSGMQVVISEHFVKRISLSKDKSVADVECDYRYDMIHSESGVELKGERKRRLRLIRKGKQWFIADIR